MSYGSTLLPPRFWEKVDPNGPVGIHSQTGESLGLCWLWTGALTGPGYGKWGVTVSAHVYRTLDAHRSAYEALVGPLSDGLELDHLCRRRSCCNPAHLEPVTHSVNMLRGVDVGDGCAVVAEINRSKTHCPRGHEYTVFSRQGPEGRWQRRRCRECVREQQRARRAKAHSR